MNSSHFELTDFSIDELEAIDKVCLRFEDDWLAGRSPDIGDFLKDTSTLCRTAVLVELVWLDVEYRTQHGQRPAQSDYCSMFPDEAKAIESAFSDRQNPSGKKRKAEEKALNPSGELPFESLKLGNEYRIERFHARGGLGEIYVAHDNQLDRTVALKIPRNRNPGSIERLRLRREAEVTGRLKHPGIVPVHAASHEGEGPPCYIMQFIKGQTFRDAINAFHESNLAIKGNKFNSREFRRLLQRLNSVCNTVAYAHDQGVIHRDIKPGNIMLGEFGETFLLDWGLAKIIGHHEFETESKSNRIERPDQESWRLSSDGTAAGTKPGQPIGTPEFASPEQVRGNVADQDGRSDTYSLGATLYYLLAGRRAVELEDLTDLSTVSAIRDILPPKSLDPDVPADLNSICMKAIAFMPEDRYRTVAELSDELERHLADEPILTRRQNWSSRIRRWIKKNPRKAYSIASGFSVALVALAISALLLTQKADQLEKSLTTQKQVNSELEVAKESAEAYAEKTENALRSLADRLDQKWFASRKSFSSSERQMLEDMLTQYQDFARSSPNPYFTRIVEAEALERVGSIQMLLGRNAESIESFGKVIDLLDVLPKDSSEGVRATKANSLYQLGNMFCETGDVERGLQKIELAFDLTESLERDFSENPGHLNRLAIIQARKGTIDLRLNHQNLAYEHLLSAKAITRNLVERFPENTHFQQTFATRMTFLGKGYWQFSNFEKALAEFQSAVKVFESIEDQDWVFDGMTRGLEYCAACNGVARSLSLLDRNEESLAAWKKAGIAAERLVEMYPAFPNAWSTLAAPNFQSAVLLHEQQTWPLAIEHARMAVTAVEKAVALAPDQLNYFRLRTVIHKELGLILQDSGDLASAKEALQQSVVAARESLELDPEHSRGMHSNRLELARTLRCLGRVLLDAGDERNAKKTFDQAVELLESTPEDNAAAPYLSQELEIVRIELARLQSRPSADSTETLKADQ